MVTSLRAIFSLVCTTLHATTKKKSVVVGFLTYAQSHTDSDNKSYYKCK